MKPSEEIEIIRKELSKKDWIDWGGNQIMSDDWENDIDRQNVYYIKAIVKYLDRKEERKNCVSFNNEN